ncbi:MAG: Smr/MutS family protein [Legionellaceae bacterium]|nr:Smr/MutS family protein [Legionellaceae bacterium]
MSKHSLSEEDKKLFRQSMSQVTPLAAIKKVHTQARVPPAPKATQPRVDNTNVPTWHWSDFIAEPVESDSLLAWSQPPLPTRRLHQLRQGLIPWQACLDLHGLRREEARQQLAAFLQQASEQAWRCVLIIHGKGGYHGSPPLIKNLLNQWLRQLPMIRAFHSACKQHGGSGAVYVLLKKS